MIVKEADLQDILHHSGHRLTGPRRLLLEIIRSQPGHPDVDELYRLARERDPHINLSTVYRTVELLRELGLVDELHLGEDHHHYEARSQAKHHHLICTACGRVVEFSSPLVQRLAAALEKEHNYEVNALQIDVLGFCPTCREQRKQGD